MRWLSEPSPSAVAEALRAVVPELSGLPIDIPDLTGRDDPVWQSSSAALGEDFVVKFAWSEAAARFVLHQIRVLEALAREPAVPFLPEVIASGTDPLILVTRRVRGSSLFNVVDSINRDYAGMQLARFLAALHGGEARRCVEAVTGAVPAWYPLATTSALRERFGRWVTPEQQREVVRWCDWADEILAESRPRVLVHGDLHGDNQIWDGCELKAILDFENVGAGEPEYELRAFPGPGMGPGLELLTAVMRHYERIAGRELSVERVMAWHIRQALGDALWRSEAGIPLPDHRAPGEWVADIATRFRSLGGLFAELSLSCRRPCHHLQAGRVARRAERRAPETVGRPPRLRQHVVSGGVVRLSGGQEGDRSPVSRPSHGRQNSTDKTRICPIHRVVFGDEWAQDERRGRRAKVAGHDACRLCRMITAKSVNYHKTVKVKPGAPLAR